MATISGQTNEKVYSIPKWLGLNEHPDGDTRLRIGEASKMVNWKITRDGNLKRRPGTEEVADLVPTLGTRRAIAGLWSGYVNGQQELLAAYNGGLYRLYQADEGTFIPELVVFNGSFNTSKGVSFIPFDGKVYILNGYDYFVYDGNEMTVVDGYRPLITIALGPLVLVDGVLSEGPETGTMTGEYINRLNGKRRVWLSPDGEGNIFQMPDKAFETVDWIKDPVSGDNIELNWSSIPEEGRIVFDNPPPKGVNSYEVGYSVSGNLRDDVTGNLFAELYSGTTDTRIFLYGDGTNRTLYSGMDYDGMPRADYFPDQYEVRIGDANTPITAMIRHYGALACYKTNEAWGLQHGIVELATDELTPAIYSIPVNRAVGNVAPGQVQLVNNSPVTAFGHELYQWSNSSYYTSNLTRDERQANRISDRVHSTLAAFDLKEACMWDDNDSQEFYIAYNKKAVVWNYAADAWYVYENFDAVKMCSFLGELYLGTSDGRILRVTYEAEGDAVADSEDPAFIDAQWESGAMDFGADYARKYAATLWIGLKPEEGTSVNVCVETDKKNTFREKVISSERAKIAGQPFTVKAKIKAKKFVYYRLLLSVDDLQPAVTVTNVDFRVRQTGYSK